MQRAYELANAIGFALTREEAGPDRPSACLPGTGQFLSVLAGDAFQVLPGRAPFDLLFADGAWRDPAGWDSLVGLLKPGGRIVMDDVTPAGRRPADSPLPEHDAKREFFFAHPGLTSAEVVLPDLRNSLLVGTRRG